MMIKKSLIQLLKLTFFSLTFLLSCNANDNTENSDSKKYDDSSNVIVGAERTDLYFELLKGKRLGIVTNQTGVIGDKHIVDSLKSAGFHIEKIFAPEHGFRGKAEAGEKVDHTVDKKTGIKIVSLYGKNFKPTKDDLKNIDIMLFDIQDVGARFYTYISTLHYVMEACAENNIMLIVLDRPNPNGFYVDGPVLKKEFKSFIGMHPVALVHGMTIGEYALMINGERWLNNGIQCNLKVIPNENYTHKTLYKVKIPPSPNLRTQEAIYLYPSLCLFEGTSVSVGRGTDRPFEIYGHPDYPEKIFSFIPKSKPGFAKNPLHENRICYGKDLRNYVDTLLQNPKLELKWLIEAYNKLPDKTKFFNRSMFDKLIGNDYVRKQIIEGKSEDYIRQQWQAELAEFKKIRKKYLLYEDFE